MVSKPNFILGIKQLSLHSKEDSYMRSKDPEQCSCLLLDQDPLHHAAPMEPPLLCRYYVSDHKPKQSVPLSLRSVHIKALPDETNHTDVLNGLPRPEPKKPLPINSHTCLHAQTKALALLTRVAKDSHTRHYVGLVVCRFTKPKNLALIR